MYDRLLVFLLHLLPARAMGNLVYVLSRSRRIWLKNALIRGFCTLFRVDTSEAAERVPEGYANFNEFFTRTLRSGARPVTTEADALACPADGRLAQFGLARDGQLLQAKGMQFSLVSLLGDPQLADELKNGPYATIYLAPYDYHRVHMPFDARIVTTTFVPGKLYSVNARTAAVVPELYAVNERLVCQFESAYGPFAVVLVGAINVASISTRWTGEIAPPEDGRIVRSHFHDDPGARVARGDYLGHFNMGSTVILIGPPGGIEWTPELEAGSTVRTGASLGRLITL